MTILKKTSALLSFFAGRFSRGVFWNLIGTIFSQGSVFLTSIILARILGKETFGEFGMILSTILALSGIAQVATGVTATKYAAEFRDVNKERAGRVLGLCSLMTFATGSFATFLLIISASPLAEHALNAPQLSSALSISAAFVLFSAMNGFQIGALSGLESFRSISIYSALMGLSYFILTTFGAKFGGLSGALAGVALSAFLRWLVYAILLHKEALKYNISILRKEGFKEKKILYYFTIPAAASGFTTLPAIWLSNTFLVHQHDGYMEMGLYSAALTLRTIVLFFPSVINNVAIALINSHKGSKDRKQYSSSFFLNIKLTFIFAFTGALLMFVSGEKILGFFGDDFVNTNASLLILLMSISVVFESMSIATYQLIQSHGKMWLSFFIIAIPRDVIIIMSAYYLTQYYASSGLAGAYVLGHFYALSVTALSIFLMNLHKKV